MQITIVAWGGHGDLRPYVALALELQKAGHQVNLATLADEKEFVSSFGVNCIPMDWNSDDRPFLSYPPFNTIGLHSNQVRSLPDGLLSEVWRVCQNAEAIIFNGPSYPCLYIAEKLGIPCFASATQPHHQTRAFPHPFVTTGKPLGKIYNWLSYPFFDQFFWQSVRQQINQWRQKILNLSPLPFRAGITRRLQQQKIPFIYSYSPTFLPKPSDWNDHLIHVTGYWFLDTSDNWQPPSNLIHFLSAGAPPVYISNIWHSEKLGKNLALEVAKLTGQRIVVQGLDDDTQDIESTDNVFFINGMIPHEWLFPKMAAIVHHGGCGTTMSCLRAGVPMIITPFRVPAEHYFWALQLSQSGLGISVFPDNEELSVESLAAAIKTVINDQNMRAKAIEIGKLVQAENGLQQAVEAFHQYI
jgi:sterol 3beta-glucosyltransferase